MQGYGDLPGQPSAYKDVVAELDPLDVDGLLSKCSRPVLQIFYIFQETVGRFIWNL